MSDIQKEFDISCIESHEGMLFYGEDIPDAKGLKFLRRGLFLGECKKKRFEPSQALAMALKKDEFKNTLDLSSADERVTRYLKGETVTTDETDGANDGTVLICVDGYPLGWGKKLKNTIKNKYHSGWRLM